MYPESQMHGDENLMSDHDISIEEMEAHDKLSDAIAENYEYFDSDFCDSLNFPLDLNDMNTLLESDERKVRVVALGIIEDLATQVIEKYGVDEAKSIAFNLRS